MFHGAKHKLKLEKVPIIEALKRVEKWEHFIDEASLSSIVLNKALDKMQLNIDIFIGFIY